MKTIFKGLMGIACFFLFFSIQLNAQDDYKPVVVLITTGHWNMDNEDGNPEEWLATEKEYHEKVTMKNEHIMSSTFLTHYFTDDNTEYQAVSVYPSWTAIEEATKRTGELIEAGWPDSTSRAAFFKKRSSYYANRHSDEIYSTLPNAKFVDSTATAGSRVIYIQKVEMEFPEDTKGDNIAKLRKEYVTNVHHKNMYVKGFYNMRHMWGANNRDQLDVFVFDSLGDLESSFAENGKLMEAQWPDEDARKAFFKTYNKYFTGKHGDYIWRDTPELRK
jgi:hypothetical protein